MACTAAAGISFSETLRMIVDEALKRGSAPAAKTSPVKLDAPMEV